MVTHDIELALLADRVYEINEGKLLKYWEGLGYYSRVKNLKKSAKIICKEMKEIGFKQLLPDHLQAPIIITFMQPDDPNFKFIHLKGKLKLNRSLLPSSFSILIILFIPNDL